MTFDGRDLVVLGDGTEVLRFSGQSGRPIVIDQKDADECGADYRLDSYMNDRRFVGIKNKGPIPEGTYTFQPGRIEHIDPHWLGWFGLGIGGRNPQGRWISADWGTGRVRLNPVGTMLKGPCGNTANRGDFFLHGGVMSGSSGCIDIGSDFDAVAEFLDGDTRPVTVRVLYTQPPPSVRFLTGLSGAIAYAGEGAIDFQLRPSLNVGLETGPAGTRPLLSLQNQLTAGFAGGSLSLTPRVDIPLDSRERFVRAGLTVDANFRLLHALYGRLRVGGSFGLAGAPPTGFEAGTGLGFDFGRVQLEGMYDILKVAGQDEPTHRVMLGIGFRFGKD
jgi:hypothetical protein